MSTSNKIYKGFTLIELVIVVAIIGILTLMIIPQFNKITKEANEKVFIANCEAVTTAITVYEAENDGEFPDILSLNPYINGGFPASSDEHGRGGKPKGAKYFIGNLFEDEPKFKASYGNLHYEYPGKGFYK